MYVIVETMYSLCSVCTCSDHGIGGCVGVRRVGGGGYIRIKNVKNNINKQCNFVSKFEQVLWTINR